jgi:glutathione synthase/RimK-type ligase-like ATP-grasp enzyme
MTERILVTSARATAALDIARDFAKAGYEVHMADCSAALISRWSRYVARVHPYASPVRKPDAFADDMLRLRDTLDPVLIVPSSEEIFHLARPELAERLGETLFAPPLGILRRLHDKSAFAELCASEGLPVPPTHRLASRADADSYAGQSADWVFKPCFSRFGAEALVSPTPDKVRAIAASPERPWVAQRRVAGLEASFYAVARGGALTAFAAYQSGWRLGGAGISFDPVEPELEARIEALAARIASAFGIQGQFACDLIVDASGQPWLIECNPRATSGVHLLTGAGGLARAMLGTQAALVRQSRAPRHLLPALATHGFFSAIGQRRLGEWAGQIRRGSDVAGNPGDRRPAFAAIVDGVGFMLAGALQRTSMTAAATADIEWNGED